MAFYGCEFSFAGRSCSEFGLMMYELSSASQGDASFPSAGKPIEERISRKYSSFFYGITQNEPLTYNLVFGANPDMIDKNMYLDRYDIERIASWLTGHNCRQYLEIFQPDMETFRYKCVITNLKLISYGLMPWAFSCTVTCDSSFAYTYPKDYIFSVSGSEKVVNLLNESTYNGYYMPKMKITPVSGRSVSITNISDNNRAFLLSSLPSAVSEIYVDNENQIIIDASSDINLYPYFNYHFFRLVRGNNQLKLSGDFIVTFTCEFPVNVGG